MTTGPRGMWEPLAGFPQALFRDRRRRVLDSLDAGALLLPAGPVLMRSTGVEHRYRPSSELFYLTGWTEPGALALLRDYVDEDRFVVFVPPRDPGRETWTGPRPGPEEARELMGADSVFSALEVEERLPALLTESRRLFCRLGAQPWLDRVVLGALQAARVGGARKGRGPRSVVDPGEVLDEMRLRKDQEELLRIGRATSVTMAGFQDAVAGVREGVGEWEVEGALEGAFRRRGGSGPAFPTIVGSGPNGCHLHYRENSRALEGGDLVLLDGGAEVGMYSGDVTRTFPVDGTFEPRQRDVYEVVLRAHHGAVSLVRPGATVAQIHDAVLHVLTEGLVDLGVLSGTVDSLLEKGAVGPYFPHQTSHWLGLDVHDVGDYVREGSPRVLEAGLVLTVEPGLYFAPGPDRPQTPFDGIGVRIEDDLLVTEGGAENLTAGLPVELREVEAMVGQ